MQNDPFEQFLLWYDDAQEFGMIESNAMTLSTVGSDMKPSGRIVLLKEVTDRGFIFYTNYGSHKARDLEVNPHVSALFFWKEHERQIRIRGQVEKTSHKKSTEYFQSRPVGSQMGAWASDQSSIISDRTVLEAALEDIRNKYEGETALPKPPNWGGYIIVPDCFEFWQGRENRLHDRIVYELKDNSTWNKYRLAP